jgi:NitT/TauT family transport system substrate-binding protein
MLKKYSRYITLMIFSLCCICGCQKKEISNKDHSKKVTLLLDWWANPNHIPIYVGLEKKFFEKEGIELDILNLQEPPDALMYVLSNQVDVSLYYLPHCLKGYARSPTFKIIGKLNDAALFSFLCRKDSGIESIKDFNGKSLGIFGDYLSRAVVHSLANEEKKIEFGVLKTLQFDITTALYTKALDMISGAYWNIEPFQLRSQGIEVRSFKWSELGLPEYPELVFISNQVFLEKNPTFAKRFRKALHESISYCLEDPEKAFELYLKQHPDKKQMEWEREAWKATYPVLAKSQNFDIPLLYRFYEWLTSYKVLAREFRLEELLESNQSVQERKSHVN